VVLDGNEPVAGVQMEIKRLRGIGTVGFVYCGPVIAPGRDDARDVAMEALHALGKRWGLRYLAVRPPRRDDEVPAALRERGFDRGLLDRLYIYFDYAVTIDLADGEAALMSRLNKKRRQNVRFAAKQGVTVRRAGREGLAVFSRLEDRHAARLGYDRREDGYFETLWESMAERGHIELFIGEFEGVPICAQLVIPFGNTSYHFDRPWSGEHPELSAPELVEWEAIRWAASEGYRYVDLGGIDTLVGEAEVTGRTDPRIQKYGASLFKLKWGGTVVVEPPFLDHVYNPAVRYLYRHVPGFVTRSSWLEKAAKRLKESGT
jgi:lipid II:glycine glycyltransferase (peptidoglycan interpeptide bridge formation enzyme)